MGRGQKSGNDRGGGRGPSRMGGEKGAGPGGYCVCPECGYRMMHLLGIPCHRRTCPKCGVHMDRDA